MNLGLFMMPLHDPDLHYLDGRSLLLSPEVSIETQRAIGSDIMMALDQCVPSTSDEATVRAAVGITRRWAARSLAARGDSPQSIDHRSTQSTHRR